MEVSTWRSTCTGVAVPWLKGKELCHIHSNGNSALYYIEKVNTSIQMVIFFSVVHVRHYEDEQHKSMLRFHASAV